MCSFLSKVSSVPENETVKVLESSNGVITERSCLITFISLYTKANMSHLYHVDIIASISNTGSYWMTKNLLSLDKVYNISLLSWRGSKHYDRLNFT